MAKYQYEIIAVPLDKPTWQDDTVEFCLYLVSHLTIKDDFTEVELCAAVDANPLWLPDRQGGLTCQIARLDTNYSRTGVLQPSPDSESPEVLRARLKEYLLGKAPNRGDAAVHGAFVANRDRRFDNLPRSAFIDPQQIYEGSVPERDFAVYALNVGFAARLPGAITKGAFDLRKLRTRLQRSTNALVMQEALRRIFQPKSESPHALQDLLSQQLGLPAELRALSDTSGSVRKDLQHLDYRVSGYPPGFVPEALRQDTSVPETKLGALVDMREPNTLWLSALKDPALSQLLGLTTKWRVRVSGATQLRQAICELEMVVSLGDTKSLDIAILTRPTVFRLEPEVSPAPKNSALGPTGAFAWLNQRPDGNNYRALQITADAEVLKTWTLQEGNNLRTQAQARAPSANIPQPDSPPLARGVAGLHSDIPVVKMMPKTMRELPDALADQAAGVNQPETRGVTFSASIDDLAPPAAEGAHAAAREAGGRYYLEDLWIGHRIDIGDVDTAGVYSRFRSLNTERVTLTLKPTDQRLPVRDSESYFEREQLSADRPTSTEITTWTGMSEVQRFPFRAPQSYGLPTPTRSGYDYENTQDLNPTSPAVARVAQAIENTLPSLRYREHKAYRIRTVFCGGVSVAPDTADDLLGIDQKVRGGRSEAHVQVFDFLRTESYSPGEIANPTALRNSGAPNPTENEQIVHLLDVGASSRLYLIPRPLAQNEMRFGGYIGVSEDEPVVYRDVAETKNVKKLLIDDKGNLRSAKYFLDREVDTVVLRAESLTHNPQTPPIEQVIEGIECETLLPYLAATAELRFGEPVKWLEYRPIRIELRASSGGVAKGKTIEHSSHTEAFALEIPPGDVVELSFLPNVSADQIRSSFFYQNAQRWAMRSAGALAASAFGKLPPLPLAPIIAERRVRVIHATRTPLERPVLSLDARYLKSEPSDREHYGSIYSLPRSAQSHEAFLIGTVAVHAPTTGHVMIEAKWKEIQDIVAQPQYVVVSASHRGPLRSVHFSERKPLRPEEAVRIALDRRSPDENARRFADYLDEQCLENTVHLIQPPSSSSDDGEDKPPAPPCNAIDVKSPGRRVGSVSVWARSRYRQFYPLNDPKAIDLESNAVLFDTPNQMVPSAVQVAYVLPTFGSSPMSKDAQVANRTGLRFYVRRSWFETGVGERCAVGCLFRSSLEPAEYAIAKKYSTVWGEDVFQRPRLTDTLRVPRASDFLATPGDDGTDLDPELYPSLGPNDRALVSYFDNVPLIVERDDSTPPEQKTTSPQGLSLASYALRYDGEQRLYYFDLQVRGEFFGWIKLAIYRHQPHSVLGCEISRNAAHVYAAVLAEDVIVRYPEQDWWTIRVGPVFDRTVSFEYAEPESIAPGVLQTTAERVVLNETELNGAQYFSLRLPTQHHRGKPTLYKLRAGQIQAAYEL